MSPHVKLPLVSLHSSLLPLVRMHLRHKFPCTSKTTNIKPNTALIFLDGTGMAGNLFLGWDHLKMEGRARLDLFILNCLKTKEKKKGLSYLNQKTIAKKNKSCYLFHNPVVLKKITEGPGDSILIPRR